MPPSTSNKDTTLTINSTITPPNTKIPIPRLGFGLWQLPGEAALTPSRAALKAGYRHLDSAQLYRNEAQVGEVLRTMAPLRREEVFVTTKQGVRGKTKEETYEMARESVRKISGYGNGDGEEGYVDLFLVHTPRGGYETRKEIWVDALERLHAEGRARLIGVSNYGVGELEEMRGYATVWPPHVNQIEVRIFFLDSSFPSLSLSLSPKTPKTRHQTKNLTKTSYTPGPKTAQQ
jgi:diketogulonate reductase-like aldo/keto reductase